jgi:DNA-binding MarR family transcriptional regulator
MFFLLQRAAHGLKKKADTELLDAGGMSTAQAVVMSIIAGQEGVSQSYLANKLMQRESAITTMANRLLKAGYITRTRSDTDGRAWVLKSTKEGLAALDAVREPFASINAILDDAFPPEDVERIADGLIDVLRQLEALDAAEADHI